MNIQLDCLFWCNQMIAQDIQKEMCPEKVLYSPYFKLCSNVLGPLKTGYMHLTAVH